MNVEIVRTDDSGRGIGYIDKKIIFVPKTVPGDKVRVEITLDKKKYSEGKIIEIIKPSDERIKSICPYFDKCGGCQYLNLEYNDSLDMKVNNFKNNLKRNNIDSEVNVTGNESNSLNYRNKISLKIVNKKIGYFEESSNNLVEIDYCYLVSNEINEFLKELPKLNIVDGKINIRSNYDNKLLISIETSSNINTSDIDLSSIEGIIHNDKVIYGNYFIMEKINNLKFEISYKSFFQVNPYITSKVFDIMQENIKEDDVVLDLYSGVGTLALNAALKAKKVHGIEIVKDAVINAKNNALINNIENVKFSVGNLINNISIKDDINTLIVDPPRSGLSKEVKNLINNTLPSKIIYMSCNPNTLIRDLNELKNIYNIKSITVFDMFSYTYHLESVVTLILK